MRNLQNSMDLTRGPVSIKLDSAVHAVAFVVLIGITCAFVFAIRSASYSLTIRVMCWIGLVSGLLLLVATTPLFVRLYLRKLPALTLTSEGFIYYVISPTLVAWTDVLGCSVRNIGTTANPARTLEVQLRPGTLQHLAMPWLLRLAYLHSSALSIGDLDHPLEELADVFERCRKATA